MLPVSEGFERNGGSPSSLKSQNDSIDIGVIEQVVGVCVKFRDSKLARCILSRFFPDVGDGDNFR